MAGSIVVHTDVSYRDNMGRFAAAVSEAETKSVLEGAEQLVQDVRESAPSGPARADYGRRPKLNTSFQVIQLSARQAKVGSAAIHAKAQEDGAPGHEIETTWGAHPGFERTITHPGNTGQHYLEKAMRAFWPKFKEIISRNIPG